MKKNEKIFKPIIAFSLLALLDTQNVFAQNGLFIDLTNPDIKSVQNVDAGPSLLRIDATQDLNITINNGSGDVILTKKSGSGVNQGILVDEGSAKSLKITSNSQQAIIIDGSSFGMYDTMINNTSTTTLTFGAGVSLVVSNGGTTNTSNDYYGLSFGGQERLIYRFGSAGLVFEQVGVQEKNTQGGSGSNATGIKVDNSSDLFGRLTFSKIVGGKGGDGANSGGKAYGITATTGGRTLRIKEGAKIIFNEIIGGDGGSSSVNIEGVGGEAGGILLGSGDLKLWTFEEQSIPAIDTVGRIVFESIKGGKSKDNEKADIFPIKNSGGGLLELQGVSVIVGEEDKENKTNYFGIHNKIENTQYILGRTVIRGFDYRFGRAPNLSGIVLDKSAILSGEVEVRGGLSGRDKQGNGLDGASALGLMLRNSEIRTLGGLKIKVAGGLAAEGDRKPNGKNGNAIGIQSLENSSIDGSLTIELIKVNEGSKQFALDYFSMVDNYGTLTLTQNSILQVDFTTGQLSRYKTPIAINNHEQIILSAGSVIRIGTSGDTITSGIYNNVNSKMIFNIGKIDVRGNDTQSSTTGFITKSSVQINGEGGVLNVYGGQDKPSVSFAFMGGNSNVLDVVSNVYGSQGQPIVGLVLGGNAELNASSMTLNLSTKQNARLGKSGDDYFVGIVLGNDSAKIASGIYTFNFSEKAGMDKIFAIKNLSSNGALTLSSQTFIPLGVENLSEATQISILYDNAGYSYEFGSGGAKTILDTDELSNGLFFSKTIHASGNLEIQGGGEKINAFTSKGKNLVGIISNTPLNITVNGRQALAESGVDVGSSVGVNIAQGDFFLQGKSGGEISFQVNGGRDKAGQNFIGEAVGILISGDSLKGDKFLSFDIEGSKAYGVKLVGSAIQSRKITLTLYENSFSSSDANKGAIVGSDVAYGVHNQGNTTLEGSVAFGDGSHASIGSLNTKQAYGLYNQSGTLTLAGKLLFQTNSIHTQSNGEGKTIYNSGSLVFAKDSSVGFGSMPAGGVQSNLWTSEYMKIQMREGSSMHFLDTAFDTSGTGKIDIDMGYDPTLQKGAKLLFEDNAGVLNTLSGKYAQISLAGATQSSIDARKKEVFTPRILTIADMQLDKSSFILFASSTDRISNQSDQIFVSGSNLGQDIVVDNSLHVILGDFKQESQTPTILAKVNQSAKDRVIFNGLKEDGKKVETTTYQGFDTAVIEVERVSDNNGNAIYQSTLQVKEQAVNEDYVNPTAGVLSTNFNLFSANLNSLNKRMGELRNDPFVHGVWTRIFTGKQSSDFGVEATSFYTTLQAGYDYKIALENSNNYIGLALSYINSSTKQAVSRYRIDNLGNVILGVNSAVTNGVELALYNSYIADNGFYSDSLMKVSYLLSDVEMFEQSRNYTTKNVGFSLSQEVGYRFAIGEKMEWIIEPQVELSYGYFDAEDFVQVLDGVTQSYLNSTQDVVSLLRSRIGVAWGYDFSHLIEKDGYKTSVYIGTYYTYDYLVGGDVSYLTNNNSRASYQAMESNGRFVLNAGVNAKLDEKTRIYFDFEKSFGNVMQIDYQFNFGVRIGLGKEDSVKKNKNKSVEEKTEILNLPSMQSERKKNKGMQKS